MCGIAGIFDLKGKRNIDKKLAEDLIGVLKHRGPDDDGYWNDSYAILVHTRLSIIDLSESGRQPMFNENESIVSTFNGEIYNFISLREDLIKKGYHFKGTSDSEILPFMYQEYGERMVDYLEGMFAFAIYDKVRKKLFVARDRLGIKPLYYHFNKESQNFYFGSEIKAIVVNKEVEKKVDYQAIYDYLGLNVIPEPATGFESIFALEAAHCLEVSEQGLEIWKYWDIDNISQINDSFKNAKEKLKCLINNSIKGQLIADARLGAFLSGGIDSSMVVANASRMVQNFPTFTVKFPDDKFDESSNAREVANHCQTDHHELVLKELSGDPRFINELIHHFDQPFADTSYIPTFLISKMMRENIKVALSGDGGDEILAGYHTFWFYKRIKMLSKIPHFFLRLLYWASGVLAFWKPDLVRQTRKTLGLAQKKNSEV